MSLPFIGLIGLIILLFLLVIGVPVAICMLVGGAAGCILLLGFSAGISLLGTIPFSTANTYTFAVMPLFVMMGLVAYEGGLTTELFVTGRKLIGHLPGGLALAVVFAQACFASLTGESLAASIIMTRIALPEMKKLNYNIKMATGAIATGGTLGPLIPPSSGFILYGIITETSIGKLFIAGILPGLLMVLLLMITVILWVKIDKKAASPTPAAPWRERFISLRGIWPVVVMFLVVIGGIYGGFFTAIEGGAIGTAAAMIISASKRSLNFKSLVTALRDTVRMTGMVFFILIGCFVFNYFITLSTLPMTIANKVIEMNLSPYVVFLLVVIILLILGTMMDVPAMILLTMPIFFPVMTTLGFDPIWFGVVSVVMSEVAFITPPFGMNVFVVAGASNVPMGTVFKGIFPYLGALASGLAILTAFPIIATFLPNIMMK